MATGYAQARSVVAHLAGDEVAANDVQLVLPETGVCSTNIKAEIAANGGAAVEPADADACCVDDAKAKATGATGCGCGATETKPVTAVAASCCGSTRNA